MNKPIIPIRDSTQKFTEIEDINHNIVLFADGSAVAIIATTAVNFGLLSEREQETMIRSYAGFLNSLSFPIQIIIRSQHKDVTAYLRLLEDQEHKQKNPRLLQNIRDYRTFVIATVKEKDVLDKKFYIAIPFSSLELGPSSAVLLGSKKKGLPFDKSTVFDRATTVLSPKCDHVLRLLAHIGLRGKQLTNEQLIRFFYLAYSPNSSLPSIDEAMNKLLGSETRETT